MTRTGHPGRELCRQMPNAAPAFPTVRVSGRSKDAEVCPTSCSKMNRELASVDVSDASYSDDQTIQIWDFPRRG